MRLPDLWAVCWECFDNAPEQAGHAPEEVYWVPKVERWLCSNCWTDLEGVGWEQDTTSLVSAQDALLNREEQTQRLIAAATRKRMGVKL